MPEDDQTLLPVDPDTVSYLIERAREFQVTDTAVAPRPASGAEGEVTTGAVANEEASPALIELKSIIDDLEPDQQVALVAVVWIGRGDFAAEDWDEALRSAADSANERTAEYLVRTPMLADFLKDGMEQLGYPDV